VEIDNALRTAVASHYSEEANDRWQRLIAEPSLDWPSLVANASELGLAPLLYESAIRSDETAVPAEILSDLRNQFYDTAGYNLLILQDLNAILSSFEEHNIDVVVLKGAALILDVYGKSAQRPMVDIDFLIHFDDHALAKELLGLRGYQDIRPLPIQDKEGLFWNEIMLVHENEKSPAVELHWHLLDNPYYISRLNTEKLLGRGRMLSGTDVPIKVLNNEDQIIHLSCHNLFHHAGGFTRSLVDIAFIVAKYGDVLSWTDLIQIAEYSDVKMAVASSLTQISNDWYTPIPNRVLESISTWKPTRRERFYARSQGSEFGRAIRTLTTLPGGRNKLRFFGGQVFPDEAYIRWRYQLPDDASLARGYLKRFSSGIQNLGRTLIRKPAGNKKSPTTGKMPSDPE
jgi:hypothetical protein